jgi:hypothetical protein
MKNIFLLLLSGLFLVGCRTAFPEAQTPDDVYYSPEIARGDYEDIETEEDRYLRMKVRNRRNWNDLNDWYTYERWGYGMNHTFGTPFHPYYNWNVFHNPYWIGVVSPSVPNRPRISNLNTFQTPPNVNTNTTNPVNPKLNAPRTSGTSNNSPTNRNRTIGSGLRDVFGPGNTGGSTPSSRPVNSNPSGSSAPVRKF